MGRRRGIVGTPTAARPVDWKTKSGRREALERLGVTFSDPVERFSRVRREAACGDTVRLEVCLKEKVAAGVPIQTIAKQLGFTVRQADYWIQRLIRDPVARANVNTSMKPRLVKKEERS